VRIENIVMAGSYLWRDRAKVGLHAFGEHFLESGCSIEWFTIPLSLLHFLKPSSAKVKAEYLSLALGKPRREDIGAAYVVNRIPLTAIHPAPEMPFLESYFASRTYLNWRFPSLPSLAKRDGIYPVDMVFFDCGGIDIYHPFRSKSRLVVYRISDFASEFPRQTRGRIESEREIIRKADLLLLAYDSMIDEVCEIRGSRTGVHVLHNSVNIDPFVESCAFPPEYAAIPEPRAIYAGSMSSWYNWDLLLEVARLRPGVSFCLIGRGRVPDSLPANVFYLGARPHEQIPAFMQHASVGLIPYKNLRRIRRIDRPLKFYEYLASGLPIVSVPFGLLTEMAPYAFFGAAPGAFAEAIDEALAACTPEHRAWLRQEARQFSWANVFERFDAILKEEGFELS